MIKRFHCMLIGSLGALAVAAALAQSLPATVPTAPARGGQAIANAPPAPGVSIRDAEWLDAARQRTVPVRLYVPTGATGATVTPRKLALVVFSHGLGGSRFGYRHLGENFAQQGVISLHLQHSGSDRAVWQGGPLTLLGNVRDAASEANALARAQDVSFALDTILADRELGARIDPQAIAIAGHSYGANTAMLVAGATVEREGKRLSVADARVRAAILLSAPPFHGEGNQATVLRDVRLPTLHITGTDDVIRVPGYGSDVADRISVFRDMPGTVPGMKALAIFEGGEHSVFMDRTRSDRALAIKAATRELCVAFLRKVFQGDASSLQNAFEAAQPILVDADRLLMRRLDALLNAN